MRALRALGWAVAAIVPLAILVAIAASVSTDLRNLVEAFGWWGLAIFLAFPAAMLALVQLNRPS